MSGWGLWRDLLQPARRAIVWASLGGIVTVAAGVGLMATSAYLISRAALRPTTILLLLAPIAGVRFFALLRASSRYGERLMTHDATFQSLARLKVRIFDRLVAAPPQALLGAGRGDWLRRASADVDRLQRLYADGLAPLVVLVTMAGALGLWLAHWGWPIALAGAGLLLMVGALVPLVTWRLQHSAQDSVVLGEAKLATELVDSIQGLADRLSTDAPARIMDPILATSEGTLRRQRRLDRIQALGEALMTGGASAAGFLVLWVAIPWVRAAHLPGLLLAMVVLAVVAAFESIRPMSAAFASLGESRIAGERILQPASASIRKEVTGYRSLRHSGLVVEHLSLSYEPQLPRVLDDVSFTLPPGQRGLVMGPSGGGKSSLLAVLARLLPYQDGTVWLGGIRLEDVDERALRAHMGLLLQRPHLFNASVRDNLRLARPNAKEVDLLAALTAVGLEPWLATLPDGLNTSVGELGQQLSGGERRRLALAQILVGDTPIWLLDEPLAGLDEATALDIAQHLNSWASGRTVLVVTHDLLPGWTFDARWSLLDGRLAPRGRTG